MSNFFFPFSFLLYNGFTEQYLAIADFGNSCAIAICLVDL
jgi:hypothetical protein